MLWAGLMLLGAAPVGADGFTPTGGLVNDSRVRVRVSADLAAATIEYLGLGDPVEVLARSANRQKIQDRQDYWYKVRAPDGREGWTFGAFVDLLPSGQGAAGLASCGCPDPQKVRSDLGHLNVYGFSLGALLMVEHGQIYEVGWVPVGQETTDGSAAAFHAISGSDLKVSFSASVPLGPREEAGARILSDAGFVLTGARRSHLELTGVPDLPSRTVAGHPVSEALADHGSALLLYVAEGTYADDISMGNADGAPVPLSSGGSLPVGYGCTSALRETARSQHSTPLFFKMVRLKTTPQGGLAVDTDYADHELYQVDFSRTEPMYGP